MRPQTISRIQAQLLVIGVLAFPAATAQTSCNWPALAVITSDDKDYPSNTGFEFTKPESWSDEITITETTKVYLTSLIQKYPSIVQASDGFSEMQARLDCENRANDFGYNIGVQSGHLVASFSANVEKHWCKSAHVPCPVFPADPLRMCLQEASGKMWGARVTTEATLDLVATSLNDLRIETTDVRTTTNTSVEQDFIRDLLGAHFLGPIGISVVRSIEDQALQDIQDAIKQGFSGSRFRLVSGSNVPDIPTYEPEIVDTRFTVVDARGGDKTIVAQITRKVSNYPESTGCFLARALGVVPSDALRARMSGRSQRGN